MILYYSPGACSLADHIALHEAGLAFDRIKVDLKAKVTEDDHDFLRINPKGYVPTLQFDDGEILTENVAILSWINDQATPGIPAGALARYRILEMLAFISSELHKSFGVFFRPNADDAAKKAAGDQIGRRLQQICDRMAGDYLFGAEPTVADAYLYVMLRWSKKNGIALPEPLPAFFERMQARPSVQLALQHEGLS